MFIADLMEKTAVPTFRILGSLVPVTTKILAFDGGTSSTNSRYSNQSLGTTIAAAAPTAAFPPHVAFHLQARQREAAGGGIMKQDAIHRSIRQGCQVQVKGCDCYTPFIASFTRPIVRGDIDCSLVTCRIDFTMFTRPIT
jgi:hypothetical protein